MTNQDIEKSINLNLPLPAGLTTTGNLDLGSYAHALPAGLTTTIKTDFFKILDSAFPEVPYLAEALREGSIDGSTYSGRCKCLVGTLEASGKISLPHDAERPAEMWFRNIRPGDTPKNNKAAKLTEEWIEEWCATQVMD